MESISSLLIAVIFLIFEAACSAAYADDSAGELHAKRRRNLLFWILTAGFFGISFLIIFVQSVFPSVLSASLNVFLSALVLLIINAFFIFEVMQAASRSHRIEAFSAFSDTMMKVSGWLFSWIRMPQSASQEQLTKERERLRQLESEASEEEPVIDVAENALDLNEKSLDEICTHRSEVISLDVNDDPEKWNQTILDNRHTFYPVYNENEEDIIGILDTRDYFRLKDGHSKKSILDHTMDQPFFVAENTTADELLHQMKKRKTYIAVVVDEYGGMTGLVTLHDILEELLGDINEAEDAIRPKDIVKLPRGLWRISGSADLEEVSKALGEKLELDDFETFSGFILGTLGTIPEDGTQLETQIGDLLIQVTSIKNHRIRQTLVRKIKPEEELPAVRENRLPARLAAHHHKDKTSEDAHKAD